MDWLKALLSLVDLVLRSPGDRKLVRDAENLKETREILPDRL